MTDAKEPESVRALRRIRELYADVDAWVTWADDGQLLEAYAGELLDHIDTLTRERDEAVDRGLELQAQLMTMLVQRDEARVVTDAITRESAIAALVEMGAIEWTHASVSQPFVDGGFDVRYAKHVIILPDAALTQEDA
jgi:hypothetical protein